MLYFLKEHLNINSANNCYISKSLLSIRCPCRNLLLRTVSLDGITSLKVGSVQVQWRPVSPALIYDQGCTFHTRRTRWVLLFYCLPASTRCKWMVIMDRGVQQMLPHAQPLGFWNHLQGCRPAWPTMCPRSSQLGQTHSTTAPSHLPLCL